MFKKTIVVGAAFLLAIVVSGCGRESAMENQVEKQLEKNLGQNAEVNLKDGEMKIKTEQGSLEVGENVSLPDGFPTDVYVIDGQIMSAMKNVMGAGYQVVIKSNKSVKDGKALFEEKLKAHGWVIGSSFDMGNAVMLSATKGKRTVQVTLGSEEGKDGTAVTINVVEQQ